MASSIARPSSRYSSIDSHSSSSQPSPSSSSDLKYTHSQKNSSKLSSLKHAASNSSGRRHPSDLISAAAMDNTARALALVRTRSGDVVPPATAKNNSNKNSHTFGTMVKKFMEKRSNLKPGSTDRLPALPLPIDLIATSAAAEEAKNKREGKASNLTATLHRKLFHKGGGSADHSAGNALTDVKANTRTLAMVLRSERELLTQNKQFEEEIQELRLLLDEKDREVEKLKDLCLKQREEIKSLKDAILFPDVMNSQLHELLEKQGSELKQARRIIPCLQKQVSSLTGQIHCLAEDLAEVKADKYAVRACFDVHSSSPQTPKSDREAQISLENSSGCPMTYGSPDEMFRKDLNPCLTPCFVKTKSKEYDQMLGYDSPRKDTSLQNSTEFSPDNFSSCRGGILSKSSEQRQRSSNGMNTARKIYGSAESKWSIGKHQNLF